MKFINICLVFINCALTRDDVVDEGVISLVPVSSCHLPHGSARGRLLLKVKLRAPLLSTSRD